MSHIRRYIRSMLVVVLLLATVALPAYATTKEQAVKAAFVFNFTKFVAWPSPYAISEMSEVSICVIGRNTLGEAVSIFEKASTPNLRFKFKQVSSPPSQPGQCHILFISQSEQANAKAIIAKAKGSLALTVGDVEGFIDKGGMVSLVKDKNKIRFNINKGAADTEGLKMSAELLEVAKKVKR